MSDKHPPRPALRKSVDAALHPALAGRTLPAALPKASAATGGKPLAKAVPEPAGKLPGKAAKRGATSDVLRPTKSDPAVKVTIEIPKSLRKRLRAMAKAEGLEPEQLAAQLVAEGLGRA